MTSGSPRSSSSASSSSSSSSSSDEEADSSLKSSNRKEDEIKHDDQSFVKGQNSDTITKNNESKIDESNSLGTKEPVDNEMGAVKEVEEQKGGDEKKSGKVIVAEPSSNERAGMKIEIQDSSTNKSRTDGKLKTPKESPTRSILANFDETSRYGTRDSFRIPDVVSKIYKKLPSSSPFKNRAHLFVLGRNLINGSQSTMDFHSSRPPRNNNSHSHHLSSNSLGTYYTANSYRGRLTGEEAPRPRDPLPKKKSSAVHKTNDESTSLKVTISKRSLIRPDNSEDSPPSKKANVEVMKEEAKETA